MRFVVFNNTNKQIKSPIGCDNVDMVMGCNDAIYQRLLDLLHDSFKERLDQNLNFDCASFNMEELKSATNNGVIITAYRDTLLVGMVYLLLKGTGRRRYGCHEYLAVSPEAKHGGVASSMQNVMVGIAKEMGLLMLTSSTATTAESSVKWHLKNGFIPFKVVRHVGKTYTTYHFFKPIRRSFMLYLIKVLSPITLRLSKRIYL